MRLVGWLVRTWLYSRAVERGVEHAVIDCCLPRLRAGH